MEPDSDVTEVYLEVGLKRVFAGAVEWPGWCRSGRDAGSGLQALFDYGPRYGRALGETGLGFSAPASRESLAIVERLAGDASTDFGAPGAAPAADSRPLDTADLLRLEWILEASWRTLDAAAAKAEGEELRRGPRGGGRDVPKIVEHVLAAERGYLSRLAWKLRLDSGTAAADALARTRQAIVDALRAAARGETPERGPRGGAIWSPRYFARRVAWHALDHAWEIEDRIA